MSRNKKLMIIMVVVLSVGTIATVVGLTSAYWIGASGDSEVAPQVETTDWNYWIKYFIYEEYFDEEGNEDGYRIVGFSGAVYEDVIIPRRVFGTVKIRKVVDGVTQIVEETISEADNAFVTVLGNSTFADTTAKTIPVTITLPTTVRVETGTFMGMSNLTTVKIVQSQKGDGSDIKNIELGGQLAFAGCNITKIVVVGQVQIDNQYAFSLEDGSLNTELFDDIKNYLGVSSSAVIEVK